VLELSSDVTILCEDCSTISICIAVHQVDGLLESVHADDHHDGSEDLLVVADLAWAGMINNSGADEVTLLEAWHLVPSSIEKNLAFFVRLSDDALDSLFRLLSDKRSDIWVVDTSADCELLGPLNDFRDPLL